MTDTRIESFDRIVLFLASVIFVGLGAFRASYPHNDFVPVYAGAHCLLQGCNPYRGTLLLYPPSILVVVFPFALFSFRTAWLLWFVISGGLFILAVHRIVALCSPVQKRLATALGAVILAGSSQLLAVAQPSTPAIALAAIGWYCLIRGRMLWGGTAALLLSLAIKPQIGGLLVIYWAVRGPHRRHAITAIAGSVTLLACGILIIQSRPESAQWMGSMHTNLASAVAPGAGADPGQASDAAMLNLQTVTSVFSQTRKVYNCVAYLIFGILLTAWLAAEMLLMRLKVDPAHDLLSMGALAVLTLLPVYHRSYDSRLLLLALPGALIVLERRRIEGILLCVLVALSSISIQHWLQLGLARAGLLEKVLHNKILLIVLLRESDLRLLVCFGLLLFALARWNTGSEVRAGGELMNDTLSGSEAPRSLSIPVSSRKPEGGWKLKEGDVETISLF